MPEGEFMEFVVTPELAEHMKKKKKTGIAVKIATSDHSDFDVTELFLQLVNDDFADYLKEKYNYRERTAESGGAVTAGAVTAGLVCGASVSLGLFPRLTVIVISLPFSAISPDSTLWALIFPRA